MRGMKGWKVVLLVAVLATAIAIPALEAAAAGGTEFGIGVPISTSFSFSSFSLGLEAYARFVGAMMAWETAIKTYTTFDSLYIRNSISGVGAFYLALGAVTNLLPYFGSTYFTLGVGLTMGHALVMHAMFNIAVSVSAYGMYWFPELRFQFGFDP
jgi:hypothetical protein